MSARSTLVIGLGLVALGLSSCGKSDGRQPTFPVTGKVLVNGKPAEHATVVFHPVASAGAEAVKPWGKVGKDGLFTLTTYAGNDGAPAGEYKVTVELWLSSGKGDEGPTSRLPGRYARPETSGFLATVHNGPTELRQLEIKR